MSQLVPSAVALKIAETENKYQAQRMIGGIGNVLLSICIQTTNGIHWFLWCWGRVLTVRGQILVSRTDDDTALPSVCTFRTFPYILPPRAHVEKHARELLACTGTFRMYTRRYSACHTTPHTQHNTTQNHTTSHGERGKVRQKKKEKEDRKREEKTEEERQDKRRDRESRQETR